MKKLTLYCLLSLLVIGCSQQKEQTYNGKLLTIEKQIKNNQPNTIWLLEDFSLKGKTSADSALHALLYMESSMRHNLSFSNDSIIQVAIRFYQKNEDADRLSRSYAAKALNAIHKESYTTALKNIILAKEKNIDTCHWTSYSISNIQARINQHSANYRHAVEEATEALRYAKDLRNNSSLIAENLILIANCYDRLGEEDSMKLYLHQLQPYQQKGDKETKVAIAILMGDYYIRQNQLEKAESYLLPINLYDLSKKTSFLLGNIQMQRGNKEKALEYWKDAATSIDYTIALPACEAVLNLQPEDRNIYWIQVQNYRNMPQVKDGEIINDMQNDYEQALKEKEGYQKAILLLCIIIVLLIIVFVFYIYHRHTMKTIKRKLSNINERYYSDIEAYNKAKKEMERLQKEIANYQEDQSKPEDWNLKADLMNAEPVLHLHRLAAKGAEASPADWREISELLTQMDASFLKELSTHTEINPKELHLCMLVRLRFIPSEIASLLAISSQNVTNMRGRLLQKMYNKKGGAKEFDNQIHNINS